MHKGNRYLSPLSIIPSTDTRLQNIGMCHQHSLNLCWIDILAPGDNQISSAVKHVEVALVVQVADVASGKPTFSKCSSRRVGSVCIARGNRWPLQENFSWLMR